jgi:hypothetical protein
LTKRLFERFRESFFLYGLASLVWYLIRTGTKPSRASYPCQKAAATNADIWVVTYVFPLLSVDTWKGSLKRRWRPLTVIMVAVALSAGYMSIRDDGLGEMSPDTLSFTSVTATETPQSDIYAVTGTDGSDGGVQYLIELMAEHGQPFYRSAEEDDLKGPAGLIDAADVVLIKVNSQWDERGGTNTDLVKALIEALIAHPDGFKGEIVVADNSWMRYMPYDLDLKQIFRKAVQAGGSGKVLFGTDSTFFPRGWRVNVLKAQYAACRELAADGVLTDEDIGRIFNDNILELTGFKPHV